MTNGENDNAGNKKKRSRKPLFLVGFYPDETREEMRERLVAVLRRSDCRITGNTKTDQQN